jgi:hypothetical protein
MVMEQSVELRSGRIEDQVEGEVEAVCCAPSAFTCLEKHQAEHTREMATQVTLDAVCIFTQSDVYE